MAHLNEHKLLSDKQYAFRYGLFLLVGNDAALNIVTQITHRTYIENVKLLGYFIISLDPAIGLEQILTTCIKH